MKKTKLFITITMTMTGILTMIMTGTLTMTMTMTVTMTRTYLSLECVLNDDDDALPSLRDRERDFIHPNMVSFQVEIYCSWIWRELYDHGNWSFVFGAMHTMGFGPCISRLVFLSGQDYLERNL